MKTLNIRHSTTAFVCALALSLVFGLLATPARAQDDSAQVEQVFKKLNPEEDAKLRAILVEPTNRDGSKLQLEMQLQAKHQAALKLGDWPTIESVYRDAMVLLPHELKYKNQFAALLIQRGDFEQGNALMREVIERAPDPVARLIFKSNFAQFLSDQTSFEAAEKMLGSAQQDLIQLPTRLTLIAQYYVVRTRSRMAFTQSQIHHGEGKYATAMQQAVNAERFAREAIRVIPGNLPAVERDYAQSQLIETMNLNVRVALSSGNRGQLDTTLRAYFQQIQSAHFATTQLIQAQSVLASIRQSQREFLEASRVRLQIINAMKQSNYEAIDPRLTLQRSQLGLAQVGQHRYPEALSEFQKLDALAGNDEVLKERVRYPFDRAVVYLYNNKPLEASSLLISEAAFLGKQYGTHPSGAQHFFTAQASGLQGVALWRVGSTASKVQAYPLLQAAVQNIMSPENADYLENIGIRKELREMIFSTYIEAAAQTNPADALSALGIADWLRGGLVQEALGDAAVRAAASNDTLSNFVRQDQDARNEIKGLRNFLSGDAGGGASPLPQIAAQMRERIALLEKTRADVQVKIKAAFPDYEKLVRPSPPSTANIQANLKADEALVVLQPTDNAVYVWAIPKDGAGVFNRASVTNAQLAALVKRLRASLDVAGVEPNRRPAFDHAAAQELYAKLLAPVQAGLAGKTSLIVAAGGALGQIPFGVLQTQTSPQATSNKASTSAYLKDQALQNAPWLIKQAAITHVPSVAAWLSMRALPHKEAAQPMMAWGDPLFNLAMANTGKSTTGEVRKVVLTRASTSVDLEKEDPRSAIKYANIPSLPETRDELTAIAKTLGADIAKDLILGSAATRESVLAQNKNGNLAKQRVVAFATHGLMAGDLPNLTQPALAMAGTKDDVQNVLAPLLTLEDVLTLKLNADWVVLSACNTAAADGKAEEALSGLARGFFYAGSRSLLVTHWAVDSESAVTLTTETFKNYQSKPLEAKAESLRQAMLTVMSNPATSHPTYWAPYALVGDGAR
jgi:CHAT domain-containing protein